MTDNIYSVTIPGPPRTKKTSQQIIRDGKGRTRIIPSKNTQEWEKRAAIFMIKERVRCKIDRPVTEPVNVSIRVYLPAAYRSDLTGYMQAVADALVKAGVLADDRWSVLTSWDGSRVMVDRDNPRIEIEIREVPS